MTAPRRAFVLRRLHSLTGVVPVGVFLVEHLWTNASALAGEGPFLAAVEHIQRMPALPIVEVFGIFAPLAFHAIYGVKLAREGKPNLGSYGYTRNWLYFLQRVTGLLTFAFVLAHLWEFRVQKWLFGMADTSFYGALAAHLSWTRWGIPWIAIGYLLGLASACFHLANGLWGFAASWGLAITRRAQTRVGVASAVLGVILFGLGAGTVVHFATGLMILSPSHELPDGPPRPACEPKSP